MNHRLARATDPDTSKEAAKTINTTGLKQIVYRAIHSFCSAGCISDDVVSKVRREHNGTLAYSSITGRFTELLADGSIYDTGERREGNSGRKQRVLASIAFRQEREAINVDRPVQKKQVKSRAELLEEVDTLTLDRDYWKKEANHWKEKAHNLLGKNQTVDMF